MQQYFVKEKLRVGEKYIFSKEQAHHARDVVRLDHERIRLVEEDSQDAFFALCYTEGRDVVAEIEEKDCRTNETDIDLTLAVALIRKEKFEFILQKAAELGVKKIVPFESSRCVVHARSERADKQLMRWNDILMEASRQCKRNRIPEITPVIAFSKLDTVKSDVNCAAYEKAGMKAAFLSECLADVKSVTVAIGPEGGFSESETEELSAMGYQTVTLGSRILRAETAAVYACAVVSEYDERRRQR